MPGLHSLNSVEGLGLKGGPGRVSRGAQGEVHSDLDIGIAESKKHINLYFILKNTYGKVSFVCEREGGPTHNPVEKPGAAGDMPGFCTLSMWYPVSWEKILMTRLHVGSE